MTLSISRGPDSVSSALSARRQKILTTAILKLVIASVVIGALICVTLPGLSQMAASVALGLGLARSFAALGVGIWLVCSICRDSQSW